MGIWRSGRFESTLRKRDAHTRTRDDRAAPPLASHFIFSRLPVWSLHSRSSGVVHSFLTPNVLGQSTENYYIYLVHHTFHGRTLNIVTCATPTLTPDPALGANKRATSPALVPYVRYHSSVSSPSPHSYKKKQSITKKHEGPSPSHIRVSS